MNKILKNRKYLFTFIGVLSFTIITILAAIVVLNIRNHNNQIKEIYISSKPMKIEYVVGEEFTFEGLKVCALQNNGKFYFLDNNDLSITGFDSSKSAEKQKIKVKYQEYTATFTITIKEAPKPTPLLVSIELEKLPDKLTYKVGEWLETKGGVILITYSDGTVSRSSLVNNEVYGWTKEVSNTPGVYTLTVKYVERGILAETTFTITVENK